MKTFVISLPDAIQRRENIKKQLDNLNIKFSFFDAFQGSFYYDNPLFFNKDTSFKHEHRIMSSGEVGCALSHLGVYKQIIKENLPFALILEDDAVISPDLPKMLLFLEKYINEYDLINLVKCDIYNKKEQIQLFDNYYLVIPKMVKFGSVAQTAGYVITNNSAKIILSKNYPVFVPADVWDPYLKEITFRGIIPSGQLIHQDTNLQSSIISGNRNTSKKYNYFDLLFYAFYTHTYFGRFCKRIYKIFFKPFVLFLKNKINL